VERFEHGGGAGEERTERGKGEALKK
jgi:hypothetical protein